MLVATNQVFLANMPVDMRKSIDTLALLVTSHFNQAVADGSYYVFYRFYAVLNWWKKKTDVNMTNLINNV